MQTETIRVSGMTCGTCVTGVTRALQSVKGVGEVKVSLAEGKAAVRYDEGLAGPKELRAAITRAGYGVDAAANDAKSPSRGCCCG